MTKEFVTNMHEDKTEHGVSPFRFARENIVPKGTRTPETPKEFIEAATNAVIVGKEPKLDTVSDASFVARSKIEAIEQNNNLPTNVRKFAEGLKDNIKEWSDNVGGDKKIGEVIRADQIKGLPEEDLIDARDLPGAGKAVEIAARAGTAGILAFQLAGCTDQTNNNSNVETPASGEAVAVGLLDETEIDSLPNGEVKDSLQTELDSVKKDCAEVPGCIEDTIQIYRVNVNDGNEGINVFSYRFANIDNAEGLRTQILSIMDGKTKETTTINKDLIAKDTKIDGIPTRVFGYIDDLGNSHYILVDRQTQNGDMFQIYDADGDVYDVITQNEKEVQAYSHLWQEPSIVKAEALPTSNPTETISFERYTFQKGDTMESLAAKYNISVSDLLSADEERIYRLIPDGGYIGKEILIPSKGLSQEAIEENQKELLDNAPEVEGYTKENCFNGFVYYRNSENQKIDIVWDKESGEVMGYYIAKNGTVLLTEGTVLKKSGQLVVDNNKEEDFDEAITLWKQRFIEQGNPFGITEDTPIQLEYRDWWSGMWTNRLRTIINYGEGYGGTGYSMTWTQNGSIRLIFSRRSEGFIYLGEELAPSQASISTASLLFYTEPNNISASNEKIPYLVKDNLAAYLEYLNHLFDGQDPRIDKNLKGAVVVQ